MSTTTTFLKMQVRGSEGSLLFDDGDQGTSSMTSSYDDDFTLLDSEIARKVGAELIVCSFVIFEMGVKRLLLFSRFTSKRIVVVPNAQLFDNLPECSKQILAA